MLSPFLNCFLLFLFHSLRGGVVPLLLFTETLDTQKKKLFPHRAPLFPPVSLTSSLSLSLLSPPRDQPEADQRPLDRLRAVPDQLQASRQQVDVGLRRGRHDPLLQLGEKGLAPVDVAGGDARRDLPCREEQGQEGEGRDEGAGEREEGEAGHFRFSRFFLGGGRVCSFFFGIRLRFKSFFGEKGEGGFFSLLFAKKSERS